MCEEFSWVWLMALDECVFAKKRKRGGKRKRKREGKSKRKKKRDNDHQRYHFISTQRIN